MFGVIGVNVMTVETGGGTYCKLTNGWLLSVTFTSHNGADISVISCKINEWSRLDSRMLRMTLHCYRCHSLVRGVLTGGTFPRLCM